MSEPELENENAEEACSICGHPFNPHLITAYDTADFSKGGEMRCPVPGCECFQTVSFDV